MAALQEIGPTVLTLIDDRQGDVSAEEIAELFDVISERCREPSPSVVDSRADSHRIPFLPV